MISMNNIFRRKKAEIQFDILEMNNFYGMLLKMKKKRPYLNINSMMSHLYGPDYENYLLNKP